MNGEEAKSCINTIELFRRLAYNIYGVIDIIDDRNCTKIIEMLKGEPHWVPCSERLPEENADILVTFEDEKESRIVPVNYAKGTWYDCIFNMALNPLKVIAWMPLPEPYVSK